jgi:type IV pilus assembly protein PilV
MARYGQAGARIMARRKRMSGASLIEVMISIFIFSIGILALVGVQATSLRAVTDARFRSDAALLANELITEARLSNRASIKLDFDSRSPSPVRYQAWHARMVTNNKLPGVAANPPVVAVSNVNEMTVTIRWQSPTDTVVRQHVVMTQFAGPTK